MTQPEKVLQKQWNDWCKLRKVLHLHLTTHIKRKIVCPFCKRDHFRNFAIPGMSDWPDNFVFFNGDVIFSEFKVGKRTLSEGQEKLRSKILEEGFFYPEPFYSFEQALKYHGEYGI